MKLRVTSLWVLLLIGIVFVAPTPLSAQSSLAMEQVNSVRENVYEIVARKANSDNVIYESPLPVDLIPYAQRTDDYISIGTAFAVDRNHFMTAAHVLSLHQATLRDDLYLRDGEGRVFPIRSIIGYDNHRDVAIFTADGLVVPDPLTVNLKPHIGSRVFAAGNALGEGVIIRDGLLTSRTDERENGEWKWLRFSAATSPGNSGGPLLDASGDVIGIVTAKSENENLNYALPIGEALPVESLEAYLRFNLIYMLPNIESRFRHLYELRHDMPLSVEEFRRWAVDAHQNILTDAISGLKKENEDDLFPFDTDGQRHVTQSMVTTLFPVIVDEREDSTWHLAQPEEIYSADLSEDRYLKFGDMSGDVYWELGGFETATVRDMFDDPQSLLETILAGYSLTRNIGNEKTRITSLGEPLRRRRFSDRWGRRWYSATWPIPFADYGIVLFAHPTPQGALGIFRLTSMADTFVYDLDLTTMVDYLYFSYHGTLAQWRGYLDHKPWLSELFHSTSFAYEHGEGLSIETEGLSLHYDRHVQDVRDDSGLTMRMGFYDGPSGVRWDLGALVLAEQKGLPTLLELSKIFPPTDPSDVDATENWLDILNSRYPYTGTGIQYGGNTYILSNLSTSRLREDGEPDFAWITSMTVDEEVEADEIESAFTRLTNGIDIAYVGHRSGNETELTVIDGLTIFQAIATENAGVVDTFIDRKIDLDAVNQSGASPVMVALELGREDIAGELLSAGANPDQMDESGHTALFRAVRSGYDGIAHQLLDLEANTDVGTQSDVSVLQAALKSASPDVVSRLLDVGAFRETVTSGGWTTLMYALRYGVGDNVRRVFELSSGLDATNHGEWNALHFATRYDDAEIVPLLLEAGVDVNATTRDGLTPLHLAVRYDQTGNVTPLLLEAGANANAVTNTGWTVLHYATRYGDVEVVPLLLDAGADVNAAQNNGWTPLHFVTRYDKPSLVPLLLAAGAEVNRITDAGWTPLLNTARNLSADTLELLIEAGADINVQNDEGDTALHIAVNYNDYMNARALLIAGADTNVQDNTGKTPLQVAKDRNRIGLTALIETFLGDTIHESAARY